MNFIITHESQRCTCFRIHISKLKIYVDSSDACWLLFVDSQKKLHDFFRQKTKSVHLIAFLSNYSLWLWGFWLVVRLRLYVNTSNHTNLCVEAKCAHCMHRSHVEKSKEIVREFNVLFVQRTVNTWFLPGRLFRLRRRQHYLCAFTFIEREINDGHFTIIVFVFHWHFKCFILFLSRSSSPDDSYSQFVVHSLSLYWVLSYEFRTYA